MTDTVITFTALLALVTNVASLPLAAALLRPGTNWAERIRQWVAPEALRLGALVAVVSTVGSLYFSEGAGFVPCELCWYQRILMYPLAVVLPIAAWRRDVAVRRYVIPLAVLGLAVSTYHALIEHFPELAAEGACDIAAPCTAPWFREFGFITLAYMAGSAFLFLGLLMLTTRPQRPGTPPPGPSDPQEIAA